MAGGSRFWPALLAVLILAAYVVPFTLLRNVHAWYGSFLFWSLFALAVIAIIVHLTRDWVG